MDYSLTLPLSGRTEVRSALRLSGPAQATLSCFAIHLVRQNDGEGEVDTGSEAGMTEEEMDYSLTLPLSGRTEVRSALRLSGPVRNDE